MRLTFRNKNKILLSFALLLNVSGCGNAKTETGAQKNAQNSNASEPALINYGVVKAYPHDTTAFTEGFLVHEGKLYESTGSPADLTQTKSLIGVVDLATGKMDVKVELDRNKYFGEGIAILKDRLYQLTYLSKVGFVYDVNTFKRTGEFTFKSKEGWGMTTDGTHLIMSDGTSKITYLNPTTFKVERTIAVHDQNGQVENINELEYIKGFLYANVYTTNTILKIDPSSGKIIGKLDLTSLEQDAKSKKPDALELNGIAYDSTAGKVYVTGKLWPNIYEIKFSY
ncbi:glutaminyl-peptide cyclotransferase [Rufibacter roseolus]|uniref:glutaminyl-peptide cyclotransferase n=1 Tax=Rufibacter roseolus TaxID=2817375 RepID=UPI001B30E8FF|nr:glutaminyl-peptide cyclotransferase [Rufibacter roseolus]